MTWFWLLAVPVELVVFRWLWVGPMWPMISEWAAPDEALTWPKAAAG